jgi:N-acetylglucosamine malate deacetylase 1
MRKLLKFIYKKLLPQRGRALFDVFPALRDYTVLKEMPFEKRIAILSPHPDDETIGCGGTLHICHLRKTEITSIFMTDGRKGNERYREEDLVITRRSEAENAASIVGIDRVIFLNNRDSELSLSSKTVTELTEILKDIRPDAIFLPFFLDNHPDHIATNKIFCATLESLPSFTCYNYCVWTPLPFYNLLVDITPYVEVKRSALEQYRSQLEKYDFIEATLSLSRYYSLLHSDNRKDGWAEVFFVCKSNEYRRLIEALE